MGMRKSSFGFENSTAVSKVDHSFTHGMQYNAWFRPEFHKEDAVSYLSDEPLGAYVVRGPRNRQGDLVLSTVWPDGEFGHELLCRSEKGTMLHPLVLKQHWACHLQFFLSKFDMF